MSSPKVLVASFSIDAFFVIPDTIDLENKEQVQEYYVWYGELYIHLVSGEKISIRPFVVDRMRDVKEPRNTSIQDADENVDIDDYDETEYITRDPIA